MMRLKVENVEKSYRSRKAVDNVSITVNQGEVVGVLGPNGAGKTTIFSIIIGILKPSAGRVFLEIRK